mmetsp:Transcript_22507/g.33933  ORF Transcript_22507/g.33933 Transcript_22507/m.33933 type:complete len:317 (-) Transcript_22507:149-1099(-)
MAVTGGLKPRKKGRSRAKLSDKRRKSLSSKDQIEQLCLWKTLAGDERDLVIERLEKELKPLLENKRVRSRVRFGFNEVSRSLERQEAQIVIWCRDVKPRALGEHLAAVAAVAAATAAADGHQDVSHAPPLAKRHPALGRLALRDGGARLGRPFGLRRLAALALLREAGSSDHEKSGCGSGKSCTKKSALSGASVKAEYKKEVPGRRKKRHRGQIISTTSCNQQVGEGSGEKNTGGIEKKQMIGGSIQTSIFDQKINHNKSTFQASAAAVGGRQEEEECLPTTVEDMQSLHQFESLLGYLLLKATAIEEKNEEEVSF